MYYDIRSFVHYPPKVEEILDGECSTLPHPGQTEYLVATGAMMIEVLDKTNAVQFMQLMNDPNRFPPEASVIVMKLAAVNGFAGAILADNADALYGEWTHTYKGKVF